DARGHDDPAGRGRVPQPGVHRQRLRRRRSGAARLLRRGLDRRGRHQVDHAGAEVRAGHPADGRDPERDDQLDRAAGARHRRLPRARPRLARGAGRPRRRLDRRGQPRGVRAARAEAAGPRRHRDGRGQHLLPQRRGPRTGLRLRPHGELERRRRGAPQHLQRRAGLRQALARRHRHHDDRPGLRGRRRRRAVGHQHAARHGHRHHHDAAGPGRGHRRAVRSGDPPGRGALRLAGARGPARRADPGHGRDPHGPGRAGVPAGRGQRRERRHDGVRRPVRARPRAARARAGTGRPGDRPAERRGGAGAPAPRGARPRGRRPARRRARPRRCRPGGRAV
ncbi:MAG: Dihydroorotate dehydrogenase (NAD(+)), catalytic subunit, partial [uncultured Frankineae bacterium]